MSALPKVNRAWVLNEHAKGPINDNTLKLKESPLPDPNNLPANNVLVKVLRLAMEPAMRPSLSTEKSYRPPHPIGQTMWAAGYGEVVASNSQTFSVGSKVTGFLGMQEYALIDTTTAGLLQPYEEDIGLEHISGLGIPGKAAHIGLFEYGKCKKGDVVLVSAAAGATGSVVSVRGGCALKYKYPS
jgi:NADPH-dependent curcumin reductase CurA